MGEERRTAVYIVLSFKGRGRHLPRERGSARVLQFGSTAAAYFASASDETKKAQLGADPRSKIGYIIYSRVE